MLTLLTIHDFLRAYISSEERVFVLTYCKNMASKMGMSDVVFDLDSDELDDIICPADYTPCCKKIRLNDTIIALLLDHADKGAINFGIFTLFHELGHHDFSKKAPFTNNFLSEWHADRFAIRKLYMLHGHEHVQEFLKDFHKRDPDRGKLFGTGGSGRKGYQGYNKLLRYSRRLEKNFLARKDTLENIFYVNNAI